MSTATNESNKKLNPQRITQHSIPIAIKTMQVVTITTSLSGQVKRLALLELVLTQIFGFPQTLLALPADTTPNSWKWGILARVSCHTQPAVDDLIQLPHAP